jgi:hypothetical protein
MIVRHHLPWLRLWPQIFQRLGLLRERAPKELHPVAGFVY